MTGVFLFLGIYGLGAALTHIGCTALNLPQDNSYDCEVVRNVSSVLWFLIVPGYFAATFGYKLYIKVLKVLDSIGYKLREKINRIQK